MFYATIILHASLLSIGTGVCKIQNLVMEAIILIHVLFFFFFPLEFRAYIFFIIKDISCAHLFWCLRRRTPLCSSIWAFPIKLYLRVLMHFVLRLPSELVTSRYNFQLCYLHSGAANYAA